MGRATTVFTIAAVTALTCFVGYAVYFDHKRRTDATFRKRLRKEQKRAHKSASEAVEETPAGPSKEELRSALQKVKDEKLPDSADGKEQYFMQNVSVGEKLLAQGEAFYLPAALSFYRALRIYPSPVELIVIYQKTIPEAVFKILMELTSLDVSAPLSASGITAGRVSEGDVQAHSSTGRRSGPPSETSSQEWENLTDPGARPA